MKLKAKQDVYVKGKGLQFFMGNVYEVAEVNENSILLESEGADYCMLDPWMLDSLFYVVESPKIWRANLRTFLTMYIVERKGDKLFYVVHCSDEEEGDYLVKRLELDPRPGEYRVVEENPNISTHLRAIITMPEESFKMQFVLSLEGKKERDRV